MTSVLDVQSGTPRLVDDPGRGLAEPSHLTENITI